MDTDQLKYPIRKYVQPENISEDTLQKCIEDIATFPARLRAEVKNLSEEQLNTEYRPDGWTVRQVVHHCADSHMNGLIRVKLTLTEDKPVIKPYLEARWAELKDSRNFPVESSLSILDGVHHRWRALLNSISAEEWERTFIHPEHGLEKTLEENTCMYAWHCNHHLAHITSLKERKGW